MRPQSRGSPNVGNFGSPETKSHLDVGLMERHKVYYKGEGGGFPQVRAVVSLVSPSLPVARPSTKNNLIMHYPTCCLVLCRSMRMINYFSFFLVPSWSFSMPLYPQNATSQGVRLNSYSFRCLHFDLQLGP